MVKNQKKEKTITGVVLSFVHFIVVLFAIYVSFNCNDGFNFFSFLAALVMPYIYLIWIVFKNGLEMCGALNLNRIRF
jgi:ABC-type polysaccharide/polyol phosphate export permease